MEKGRQEGEGRQGNERKTNNASVSTWKSSPNIGIRDRSKAIPAFQINGNQNPEIKTDKGDGFLNITSGASPSSSSLPALNSRNGILCCMGIASVGLVSWLVSVLASRLRRPPHPSQDIASHFVDYINISDQDQPVIENCPICREAFQTGQDVRRLPCGHIYHDECLSRWITIKTTCPVCRREFPPDCLMGKVRSAVFWGTKQVGRSGA